MISRLIVNLDEFVIIKSLGSGSFGQVYLVKNNNDNKNYAAKVSLHPSSTDEDQRVFFSEIETLLLVQFPSILGFIGFNLHNFSKENFPTIITEYMPNDSLKKVLDLERHALASHDWTTTKKYINLLGISLGMQYLHHKQMVHRDLKPENILLDENYYPHICDFGFSKYIDGKLSVNLMKSSVGTPLYMAPEILLEKEYNYKVDVYSFSLIAYEIITGREPIIDGNFLKLMNNITQGKRPDLSIVKSKNVKFFLEKCWSNDPNQRPSFDQIIETLCEPSFYSSFDFDNDEIIDYIKQFPIENKIITNFCDRLEETNRSPICQIQDVSLPADVVFDIKIIGPVFSGITALFDYYINGFVDHDKLIGTISYCNITKNVDTEYGSANLKVWDYKYYRGNHGFPFHESLLRASHGFILTIPVNNKYAIEEDLQEYIDLVEKYRNGKPAFLVATKCDLEWELDEKKLIEIADKYDYLFFKTSALTGENVDLVFKTMTNAIIQKYVQGFYPNDKSNDVPLTKRQQENQKEKNDNVNNSKKCIIY